MRTPKRHASGGTVRADSVEESTHAFGKVFTQLFSSLEVTRVSLDQSFFGGDGQNDNLAIGSARSCPFARQTNSDRLRWVFPQVPINH